MLIFAHEIDAKTTEHGSLGLLNAMTFSLGVTFVLVTLLWLISLAKKDSSIVDPFWGLGFVIIAWCVCYSTANTQVDGSAGGLTSFRSLDLNAKAIVLMTTIWGLRLCLYLTWRNLGHGEDPRYQAMRDKAGNRFWWRSLITIFWLQGLLMWLISMPVQAAIINGGSDSATEANPLGWLVLFGILIWAIGLFFETVSDFQLARFRAQPDSHSKVLDSGLWRFTRHPNYFGDFCVWWGLYFSAIPNGAAWTIFSPIMMTTFLMFVSGVTLTEKTITSRRPGYAEYQRRTNAFFPGPPRTAPTTTP